MKQLALLIALIAAGLTISAIKPNNSCAFSTCLATSCFDSSICGSGCVCLRTSGGNGRCASIR